MSQTYDLLLRKLISHGYKKDDAHYIILDYLMGMKAISVNENPSDGEKEAIRIIGGLTK